MVARYSLGFVLTAVPGGRPGRAHPLVDGTDAGPERFPETSGTPAQPPRANGPPPAGASSRVAAETLQFSPTSPRPGPDACYVVSARMTETRGISVRSTACPSLGGDSEATVVGVLFHETSVVTPAGFHQAKALKNADRPLVGIQGLGPDLLKAETAEAVVKGRSRCQAPEPLTPAASPADGEPELASMGLVSVQIDVADKQPLMGHANPDQFWRR